MKGIKKLISSLLVVCMVCGVAFSNVTTQEVQATENAGATTNLADRKDLNHISFEDLALQNGTYTSDITKYRDPNSSYYLKTLWKSPTSTCMFDNVVFTGKIILSTDATKNDILCFGGNTTESMEPGLRLLFGADGNAFRACFGNGTWGDNSIGWVPAYSTSALTPATVGLTSFRGVEFELSVAFERKNLDGGTSANDCLLTIYINGQTLISQELTNTYSSSRIVNLTNRFRVDLGENNSISVTSCRPDGYYKDLTFADFGLKDQSVTNTNIGGIYPGTLDYTNVSGRVTTKGGSTVLNYGAITGATTINRSGLRLTITGDGKVHPAASGFAGGLFLDNVGSLVFSEDGSDFESTEGNIWSISAERWDLDGDGTRTDGKIGVRVNGKLLGGVFMVIKNMFGEDVALQSRIGLTGTTEAISIESFAARPENLRKLTLADFGITDGVKSWSDEMKRYTGSSWPKTLLNTEMTLKIKAESSASGTYPVSIYYAVQKGNTDKNGTSYGGNDYGINITITEGGNMLVYSQGTNWTSETTTSAAVRITPADVGFPAGSTFVNTEFTMSLYLLPEDFDGDSVNDDVRFDLWVEGKLHLRRYFTDLPKNSDYDSTAGGKMPLGNQMNIMLNSHSKAGTVSVELTNPTQTAESFEEIGLQDMNGGGLIQQDYQNVGDLKYSGTPVSTGSLHGTILKTNVKFGTGQSEIIYGAPSNTNKWYGLRIGCPSNLYGSTMNFYSSISNAIVGEGVTVDTTTQRYIHPGVAGVDVVNNTFQLGISVRHVDSDGDNVFDDAEVGLWFDDKLYNNAYFYLPNIANYLKPNLGVYVGSTSRVVLGDYIQETPTDITHCADEFAYFADGDSVRVAEDDKGTSWNTSQPGVYEVTYNERESQFKESVTVYKTNDVTADGVVDVKDLVALKKLVAGERENTAAPGLKAVTVNKNSSKAEQKAALKAMREQFLASKNTIGAKEFSEEIIGQLGQEGAEQSTWITNVGMTEQGTSVLSLSNAENSTYQSDLTDLNGSGLDFILDFEQDKEIKVLQLTDTQVIVSNHLGDAWKDGQQDTVLYNELRALLAQEKPDLVLITGDIVYGNYDPEGQQLQKLIDVMESCNVPWAPIFGNHDNESSIGVAKQCEMLEAASHCLFNRRHEIGGNGNYAIGISVNGTLKRTIFMMDSNGCSAPGGDSKDDVRTRFGFASKQIAWYRTIAAKANAFANTTLPSFFCMHVQPAEMSAALVEKGYQATSDIGNSNNVGYKINHTYDLGDNITGDFGIKEGGLVPNHYTASMCDYILPYLKAAGTDGTFFGHEHTNSLSVVWEGIRWTFGLKTGKYDASPTVTGGTSIMFDSNDSSNFTVQHVSVQ